MIKAINKEIKPKRKSMNLTNLHKDAHFCIQTYFDPEDLLHLTEVNSTLKNTVIWDAMLRLKFPFSDTQLFPTPFETFKYETLKQKNWRQGTCIQELICPENRGNTILGSSMNSKWWVISYDNALLLANRTTKQVSTINIETKNELNKPTFEETILHENILACRDSDCSLKVYDLVNSVELMNYQHNNRLTALQLENGWIAFGSSCGEVGIYSNQGSILKQTLQGAIKSIQFSSFSLLSAGANSIIEIDLNTYNIKYNSQTASYIKSFIPWNENCHITGSYNGEIAMHDRRAPPAPLRVGQESSPIVCLAKNENLISAANNVMRQWDMRYLKIPLLEKLTDQPITSLQADSTKIVYGDYNGTVRVTPLNAPDLTYSAIQGTNAVKNLQFRETELVASFYNGEVLRCNFSSH